MTTDPIMILIEYCQEHDIPYDYHSGGLMEIDGKMFLIKEY